MEYSSIYGLLQWEKSSFLFMHQPEALEDIFLSSLVISPQFSTPSDHDVWILDNMHKLYEILSEKTLKDDSRIQEVVHAALRCCVVLTTLQRPIEKQASVKSSLEILRAMVAQNDAQASSFAEPTRDLLMALIRFIVVHLSVATTPSNKEFILRTVGSIGGDWKGVDGLSSAVISIDLRCLVTELDNEQDNSVRKESRKHWLLVQAVLGILNPLSWVAVMKQYSSLEWDAPEFHGHEIATILVEAIDSFYQSSTDSEHLDLCAKVFIGKLIRGPNYDQYLWRLPHDGKGAPIGSIDSPAVRLAVCTALGCPWSGRAPEPESPVWKEAGLALALDQYLHRLRCGYEISGEDRHLIIAALRSLHLEVKEIALRTLSDAWGIVRQYILSFQFTNWHRCHPRGDLKRARTWRTPSFPSFQSCLA